MLFSFSKKEEKLNEIETFVYTPKVYVKKERKIIRMFKILFAVKKIERKSVAWKH